MTIPDAANVNFAVYNPDREAEDMKYNTNELAGDALQEAADKFKAARPADSTPPPQPGPATDDAADPLVVEADPDYTSDEDHHNGLPAAVLADAPAPTGLSEALAVQSTLDGSVPSPADSAATIIVPPTPPAAPPAPPTLLDGYRDIQPSPPTPTPPPTAQPIVPTPPAPLTQPPAPPAPPAVSTPALPPTPAGPYRAHPPAPAATGPAFTPPAPTPANWVQPTDPQPPAPGAPQPWVQQPEATPPPPPTAPPAWVQQPPPEPAPPQPGWVQSPEPDPTAPPRSWASQPPEWSAHPDWAASPPPATPPPPPRWGQQAAPQPHYPHDQHAAPDRPVTPPPTTRRAPMQPPPPPLLGSAKNDHAFALQDERREGPRQGLRAALHRLHLPVGKSAAELAYDRDIALINKAVRYSKTIGFATFKGGVGKTTCCLCLASTIAEHRTKGEVVAIDTDDRGSLARRVRGDQHSDIFQFVADPDLQTPNEVKSHMMSNAHRLSVLGSSSSGLANALQPLEYIRALEILQNNHLFVCVDMDTSAASPAYETIMHSLDALVLVISTSLDSAEAGRDLREWIRARDLQHVAANTLVLINHQSPAKPFLDLDGTASYFRNTESCEVLEIPWDEHLSEAGPVSLDLLNKGTRRQFVKAAATILEMLPST